MKNLSKYQKYGRSLLKFSFDSLKYNIGPSLFFCVSLNNYQRNFSVLPDCLIKNYHKNRRKDQCFCKNWTILHVNIFFFDDFLWALNLFLDLAIRWKRWIFVEKQDDLFSYTQTFEKHHIIFLNVECWWTCHKGFRRHWPRNLHLFCVCLTFNELQTL